MPTFAFATSSATNPGGNAPVDFTGEMILFPWSTTPDGNSSLSWGGWSTYGAGNSAIPIGEASFWVGSDPPATDQGVQFSTAWITEGDIWTSAHMAPSGWSGGVTTSGFILIGVNAGYWGALSWNVVDNRPNLPSPSSWSDAQNAAIFSGTESTYELAYGIPETQPAIGTDVNSIYRKLVVFSINVSLGSPSGFTNADPEFVSLGTFQFSDPEFMADLSWRSLPGDFVVTDFEPGGTFAGGGGQHKGGNTMTFYALMDLMPHAWDRSYGVEARTVRTVDISEGVLWASPNETDLLSNPVAVLTSPPSFAQSFSMASDGSFSYLSTLLSGVDSFTYRIDSDEGSSRSGLVTLTVTNPNVPPTLPGPAPDAIPTPDVTIGTGGPPHFQADLRVRR